MINCLLKRNDWQELAGRDYYLSCIEKDPMEYFPLKSYRKMLEYFIIYFQILIMLLRRILSLNFSTRPILYRHASSSSSSAPSLIDVSCSDNNQICRIKLNNPRQRNILSLAMINELIKALEENEQRSRVIVLTAGDQTVFSSGHSLKELAELSKAKACASVFDRCTELMLKYDQSFHR